MPTVSVIIPNYNHASYLKQRIESVINQTYKDFEIIVLDDCSTDNSVSIIEEYKMHSHISHIIYNEANSGSPFKQWAKGIQLAKGEYIWIAESDDWSETTFLGQLMAYARKFPDVCLLYTDTKIVYEHKVELMGPKVEGDYKYFNEGELLKERLLNGIDIYNGSAVVFKKEAALSYLHDLIQYQKHGDYFLWVKIAEQGTALFINKPLNNFRIVATSVTRQSSKDYKSLEEQLNIFKLLSCKIVLSSSKQQLIFYDCWSLKFSILQKQFKGVCSGLLKFTNVRSFNFYNSFFWLKFAYHYCFHRIRAKNN